MIELLQKVMDVPRDVSFAGAAERLKSIKVMLGAVNLQWIEKFCDAGGHICLLTTLGSMTTHLEKSAENSADIQRYKNLVEGIPEAIKCLRALINTEVCANFPCICVLV